MSVKDDRLYLSHIRDAIDKIFEYTKDGKEAFFASGLVQDAVIRNFEIIGEAAKQLTDLARNNSPEIPWRRISSFRDVLIHNYAGVNILLVWNTISDQLPQLRNAVDKLLRQA